MEKLPMCRICLVKDVRMYVVVNKNLHELYEKLTDVPFVTEDRRPMLACYFCCTKLKQCYRFLRKCLEAEELFSQMMNEDYVPHPSINPGHLEFFNGFSNSPIELISIVDGGPTESDAIKEELPDVGDGLHDIIDQEEELRTDGLELENVDHSYTHVKDTTALHTESDAEDDVPLIDIKIEVEDEQNSTGAPVAKKPELNARKSKLGDTMSAELRKNDNNQKLSCVSKIVKKTQNHTSNQMAYYKEPIIKTKNGNISSIQNIALNTNSHYNSDKEDTKCIISNKGINREKRFECNICPRSFSIKRDLTRHICTHNGEKPFKCDICQKSFNQKSYLASHVLVHTGVKPFQCNICPSSFKHKHNLAIHIRVHTGVKPFKCEICQRSFTRQADLKSHVRVHTNEKPFKCTICQSSFNQKSYLAIHIRTHTGEKPLKCDICQRSFSMKSNLIRHIRTHTAEKRFKCDLCQRCFNSKCGLTKHNRVHTGEKPFKCEKCQRSFAQKPQLANHIHVHTGEKPFKCEICQRSFSVKCNLVSHTRIHTGEKPFKCDICQRSFTQKINLASHIRVHTRCTQKGYLTRNTRKYSG